MARGNSGRNNGRGGGRNGARNGGSRKLPDVAAASNVTPIQDAAIGSNGSSSQDVQPGNNEIPVVVEPVVETSAHQNPNTEESQTSNEGENGAANCVRTSIYEPLNGGRTVNGRQVLCVINKDLWPSCARSIRKIFENKIDLSGYKWSTVTKETKQYYFDEFRKRNYWDEAIEELIKIAWDKAAHERYKGMVYSANKNKKKLPFVPQNIWDEWQKYFTSEEFLRMSQRNSENKKGGKKGVGPSCHTAGSIRHLEHARRMAKKMGRDPTLHEIFVQTHTLKNDRQTLVDDKARKVNERVINLRQQRMEEREDNTEDLDENQIFLEAAAGPRSDRIYGIGSVASLHSSNIGSTSAPTPAPAPSAEYTAQLEQEVKTLQQQYGSLQEEIIDLRQQVNQRDEERLRELIREMLPSLSTNQTGSSSNSRPAPHSK